MTAAATIIQKIDDAGEIWTAKLCRSLNGIPENFRGVAWCGLCKDYANPRKRARSKRLQANILPGFEHIGVEYQLHESCQEIGLTTLRKILYKLEERGYLKAEKKAKIPDFRQPRGWDFGTIYRLSNGD